MSDNKVPPTTSALSSITACPSCDLLIPQTYTTFSVIKVKCPRCSNVIHRNKKNCVSRTLALALSGLLLYVPAISQPLITFRTLGMSESGNVLDSIFGFYHEGYFLVASVVLLSAVLFPFLKLSLLSFLTLCIKSNTYPSSLPRFFRLYIHLDEWSMVEIYLLGIMVTIIKMYPSMDIMYGIGFFSFTALVLLTMGSSTVLDKALIWESIENKRDMSKDDQKAPPHKIPPFAKKGYSAQEMGLVTCRDCNKVFSAPHLVPTPLTSVKKDKKLDENTYSFCPRCSAKVHSRKPNSISRTWALLLTSLLFFIPANVLPIMRVNFWGIPENSTILDGIYHFFSEGSYGVGIIILTASILVPLFKIFGLFTILLTLHLKRDGYLQHKAMMFRFIAFIGRWSMLDIFVIALLAILVNFGLFTTIEIAPAATYFCMVVITTMFAAITFDSRLLWDQLSKGENTPFHQP